MSDEFNPQAPCSVCGEPVSELSYGGPTVCPWCDSGYNRDGTHWTHEQFWKRWRAAEKRRHAEAGFPIDG